MFRRPQVVRNIPPERLLTETDHPYGDRTAPPPRRPGNVLAVEYAIARIRDIRPDEVRHLVWRNLDCLVRDIDCGRLLPRRIRSYLIAAGSG